MFGAVRTPPRRKAFSATLLALGLALAFTSYFGNAVPLFFGVLNGLYVGAVLAAAGIWGLAR